VDSPTGRFLFFWIQGVLPTDNPIEGLRNWTLHYSISEDGGRTESFNGQIIHEGSGYDAIHHLPGVTRGKNCAMMGDLGMRPLTRKDGTILVPVQSSPLGPDGEYYNPSGGYTYLDSMVLIGRWTPQGTLAWRSSARMKADPELTTRGVFEPTLAELNNGRLMMVMRGSNDSQPKLPARKWLSFSNDGGQTWTDPAPWTYTDGTTFFSPSSCSQLVPYSDGRLFWFGNICPVNARGNGPRYPLIIAEVDRVSGLLESESVTVIDDRQPEETPQLFLSNFLVREDRETRRLVLHLTRLFAKRYQQGDKYDWTADSLIYELDVTG
jgi:hypothetical protein